MLGILGGSTWVSHTTLKELSITMLGHCCCSPQFHIHRLMTILLLMVWQRLCCWLGPPWWWHVGGILSIVGDLGDAIVGAVAVPIVFSNWYRRFKNYCDGGITRAAQLSFPINNSSVSVLIFVEANAYSMSVVQAFCLSYGRNTLIEWVFMSHPRHVLCLASCPSSASFL